MAYRRSLTTSARLVARQRVGPSICYEKGRITFHSDEERVLKSFLQSRSYGNTTNTCLGFGGGGIRSQFPMTASGFFLSARNMSTTNGVSEVAVAAVDSWPPVAALQHAIDGIHVYTGLNWWASIVITTLVIRTLSIPLLINQLKATSKFSRLLPELEQIRQEVQQSGMSPMHVAEGQERKKRIYKEHGVTHFTPLRGVFITGTVFGSFYLAIQNMVEKVPSLQTGGISWFIDLTTADSFYILPVLGALSFWANTEANMQEGVSVSMKNVVRGFSALTVPLAATFSNAHLCYWITYNSFSLAYGLIIRRPSVKKLLNITIVDLPLPPSLSGSSLASSWRP